MLEARLTIVFHMAGEGSVHTCGELPPSWGSPAVAPGNVPWSSVPFDRRVAIDYCGSVLCV